MNTIMKRPCRSKFILFVVALLLVGVTGCTTGSGETTGDIEPRMERASEDIPTELRVLTGQKISLFTEASEALGYTVRVVRLDGESVLVSANLDPRRVNVAVEDEAVVSIQSIG